MRRGLGRFALRAAIGGVVRYPLRSTLALLGLVVGVGSVVGTIALLDASRRLAADSLLRFGALDVLRITTPAEVWRNATLVPIAKRPALVAGDVDRIRAAIPALRAATIRLVTSTAVKGPAATVDAVVVGCRSDLPAFQPLALETGRFLRPDDETSSARVAVLTPALAADLFGSRPAVGEEVQIRGQRLVVVGIARPPHDGDGEEPRVCYVPCRVALERLGVPPDLTEVLVAAGSIARVRPVRAELEAFLGRLRPGIPAASYEIEGTDEDLDQALKEESMQATVLGGVAALAMVAAATGILNTLLVGVRERTREIGTRRAIGARRRSILGQFLAEALVLAVPGALLGLGFGALVARLLGVLFAAGLRDPTLLAVTVGWREAVTAAVAAIAIALGAGLWPAWQASRTVPAEALHYE